MTNKQLELNISTTPVFRPEQPQYPNTFSQFPIFAPVSNRKLLDTKDWDSTSENTYQFSWGTLQRLGPGLNMYDEDTLIGLFHLGRQHHHKGLPSQFPIPESGDSPSVATSGVITPYEVAVFLRRGDSGRALKETWDSIRRLSLVTLTVTTTEYQFANVSLFKLKAQDIKNPRGRMLIQFPPEVCALLSRYIAFDIDLRMSLTDLGKAIYRVILLLEPGRYEILVQDLASQIGYGGRTLDLKNLCMGKKDRKGVLDTLVSAGILDQAQLIGRGKKSKFIWDVSER